MNYEKEYNRFVSRFIKNKKLDILRLLAKGDVFSLTDISKGVGSYGALMGFYLNGNEAQPFGLVEMGLVKKFIPVDTFIVRYKITEFGKHIYSKLGEVAKDEN